jgi:hypothetical protein
LYKHNLHINAESFSLEPTPSTLSYDSQRHRKIRYDLPTSTIDGKIRKCGTMPVSQYQSPAAQSHGPVHNTTRQRRSSSSSATSQQNAEIAQRRPGTRNVTRRTQSNALVADYVAEVALADQQVFAEACRAIMAVCAVATAVGPLLVRVTNLAWAIGGLTLAVGKCTYAEGKRMWSERFR